MICAAAGFFFRWFAFRSALPILFSTVFNGPQSLFIGIYIFVSPGLLFSRLMQMRFGYVEDSAVYVGCFFLRVLFSSFFHFVVIQYARLACELCFEFEFAQESP